MSSQERIEANRANSLNSTGPTTPEGKARASRNALKHGLLSREVVLETEDRAEFEEFREGMLADLRPQGDLEATLGDRIAGQWWRLKRVGRLEACLFARDEEHAAHMEQSKDLASGLPPDAVPPATMGEALAESLGAKHCPYENLRRYERTIERGLESAMRQFREAQRLRVSRLTSPDEAEEKSRDNALYWTYQDLLRSRDRAKEELKKVRALAEAAGVQIPPSRMLAEPPPGMSREDFAEALRRNADREEEEVGFVSQESAERAAGPADGTVPGDITGRKIEPDGAEGERKGGNG